MDRRGEAVGRRVAVACDRIANLDSARAGTAIARGFSDRAEVAVIPVAAWGLDLLNAVATILGAQSQVLADRWFVAWDSSILIGYQSPPGPVWDPSAESSGLGEWVAQCLTGRDVAEVVLDLTCVRAQDGGAGMLAATEELLLGRQVSAIVAADELNLPATGIGGGLARRAFADGVAVADLLAADGAMQTYAESLGEGLATRAGGGAAGTTALAVLGLGGGLIDPVGYCAELSGAAQTFAAADLVVTGRSGFSPLDRGGPVVSAVADLAALVQRPCICFVDGPALSRRELRNLGIEAAHRVREPMGEDDLTAAAARVAAGWVEGGAR